MEASKALISDGQRKSLQELVQRADELHLETTSAIGFTNPMKMDCAAVAWNAKAMLRVKSDETQDDTHRNSSDFEHAKRLEMWVSLYGGDASDINQKIKAMEAVLDFWADQVKPSIKDDQVKPKMKDDVTRLK